MFSACWQISCTDVHIPAVSILPGGFSLQRQAPRPRSTLPSTTALHPNPPSSTPALTAAANNKPAAPKQPTPLHKPANDDSATLTLIAGAGASESAPSASRPTNTGRGPAAHKGSGQAAGGNVTPCASKPADGAKQDVFAEHSANTAPGSRPQRDVRVNSAARVSIGRENHGGAEGPALRGGRVASEDSGVKRAKVVGGAAVAERITVCIDDSDDE